VALQFMEEEKNYAVPSPANSTGNYFLNVLDLLVFQYNILLNVYCSIY